MIFPHCPDEEIRGGLPGTRRARGWHGVRLSNSARLNKPRRERMHRSVGVLQAGPITAGQTRQLARHLIAAADELDQLPTTRLTPSPVGPSFPWWRADACPGREPRAALLHREGSTRIPR